MLKSIYEKHHKMVYNLVLYYLQNVQDTEEIVQDIFVSVYENIDNFQGKSSIKTWLYRIAINKSLDFIKAKKSKKNVWNFVVDNAFFQEHNDDFYTLISKEKEWEAKIQSLFAAIEALPNNQKSVIILMKLQGKSQAKTAEILNVSVKAVESLYQRAKENLKKTLKNPKD